MVFSSVSFLLCFLPCLSVLYYLIPKSLRSLKNGVLLFFSLFFYGYGGPKFLILMLCSIAIFYLGALLCQKQQPFVRRRLSLIGTVLLSVGALCYFKYTGFFVTLLNSLGTNLPIPQITLPIGISFYTFQGLSYVIDVYQGKAEAQRNPLHVALYISLFPQLVAGPIVRYSDVARDIVMRKETIPQVYSGLIRFLCGLGKKMLLANGVGAIADEIFGKAELSVTTAWIGAFSYALQIYFDFSAYSDMAIGLGGMFGFTFSENFNYPYISCSVTEFWRRWHISLSVWFRDYVYIPLGGNRCSKLRQLWNLLVVWFLTGFWHGASWNFIFWGIWFFVLLIFEKFVFAKFLQTIPRIFGWIYTMLAVLLSWVLFRTENLRAAWNYIVAMFGGGSVFADGESIYYLRENAVLFVVALLACIPIKNALKSALEKRNTRGGRFVLNVFPKAWSLAMLFLSYLMLATGSFNPFIYFRF